MESWGVLVWNMALMSLGSSKAEQNMAYLSELMEEHAVKVALLNEGSIYHFRAANTAAENEGRPKPFVFSEEGTLGRDSWTERGERKLKNRRDHSAAVMSRFGPEELGENEVRATSPSGRRPDIPFTNPRPGTWVAATVRIGAESVTCISLYGLMEELTDASMHRSLSDISPIFSDPRHKELVLLGGDFNISTGLANPSARKRSRIVLDRIEAYGMKDCLAKWREKENLPPMDGCRCQDKPCRHTLTRVTPNKSGEKLPWQERDPIQVDYLFASDALFRRLDKVIEIPPDQWERYGDHSPIIAKFHAS